MISTHTKRRVLRVLASNLILAAITCIAFWLHAKAFIVGFLYLLLVLPVAFQGGFLEASIVSFLAIACLDYFFTEPLFQFYMSDPQDWIALGAFEAVVLTVSRLASRLRQQTVETAAHEANVDRLYTMSRELLLINRGEPSGAQLARLISEVFDTSAVGLWSAHEGTFDTVGTQQISEDEVRAAYLSESSEDHSRQGTFIRTLWLGCRAVGALCLVSGAAGRVDSRTVDAIASLAAISIERQRAFLKESTAEASRQTERLRSAVLDGLAHAFKTPLATIQTASSGLLELHRLGEVEEELVTTIHIEAQHLSDLTTRALQAARIDDEHMKVQPESISLRAFVETDWLRFAQGLADHNLEISGDLGGTVWADPRLLQMAVSQYLDNASKYAEPASPISLRVMTTSSETVFCVHNFGPSIPAAERERIFQRFYRSPESRYRVAGTGIGLTVAKQIAEAHRGRVWLESDPNTGTYFYLGLPIESREAR